MANRPETFHKFESLRQRAEQLLRQQNKPSESADASTDILELICELEIHQAEIEIQNEELKRAQTELTQLYRMFEDLYELAPCAYLNLDTKGIITRINLAGTSLLNAPRQHIVGSGLSDYFDPPSRDMLLVALQQAGCSGQKQNLELGLDLPRHPERWVWADIQADRNANGEVRQWHVILSDISEKKIGELALQASEDKYHKLFHEMVSAAALVRIAERDVSGKIVDICLLEVNTAFERLTGIDRKQAVNRSALQIWPRMKATWFGYVEQALRLRQPIEVEGVHPDWGKYFLMSAYRLDEDRLGVTFIDISAHKKLEATLTQARQDLEEQVRARTAQLRQANLELRNEIESRKRTEVALKQQSKELKIRTTSLEEANIALKVLLEENAGHKSEVEENVVCNINETIRPHLVQLSAGRLSARQQALINAISASLDDITAPLSRRFIIEGSRLTPAETQVANLIRQGKSTKDIAAIMGVAVSTVDFHRLNIRRKLNLTNRQVNLQSHLKSLH